MTAQRGILNPVLLTANGDWSLTLVGEACALGADKDESSTSVVIHMILSSHAAQHRAGQAILCSHSSVYIYYLFTGDKPH